jgi:hypothetical protein
LPSVALLFAPLGYLSGHQAAILYWVLGVGAALATIFLLAQLAPNPRRAWLALVPLFLVNGPLIYSFKEGNTSHFVLLALAAALVLMQRRADFGAGLLFGLAALIKPPLLLVGLYSAFRRRWRIVLGGAIFIAASVLLSLAVFGLNLHKIWFDNSILPFIGRPVHAFNVQSVDGFLARAHFGANYTHWGPNDLPTVYRVFNWLAVLAILATSFLVMRRDEPNRELLDVSIVITIALIISPLSWIHYYCLLLIPWGLYVTGYQPLRSDVIADWLMIGGIILASLPAIGIPGPSPLYGSTAWLLIGSSWLWGGLLTLAALLRCRALKSYPNAAGQARLCN